MSKKILAHEGEMVDCSCSRDAARRNSLNAKEIRRPGGGE
jgi:hypothetical protein